MLTAATAPEADETERVYTLRVRLSGGDVRDLPALGGMSLMELLRANEVPIIAECGGAAVCASCHIRIPARFDGRLPPPGSEEMARLDDIPGADETSRLACQIRMEAELDGIEIDLQSDSLRAAQAEGVTP